LLQNLLKDNYPILFEGLHCCYYLNHPGLTNHKKLVRTHNVEHKYYEAQSTFSRKYPERFYFLTESRKLKHFEKVLHNADKILAISPSETRYFSEKYGKTEWLSAFHSSDEVSSIPGKGKYILMHGNLMVNENETAMIYAMKEVLSSINFPVIIAGQNPSLYLTRIIRNFPRVTFIESPDDEELNHLIRNAHINLLITFQKTGLKLKLIYALFKGRFVVVNPPMINGTGLDELVYSAKDCKELIHSINKILDIDFDMSQIEKRRKLLKAYGNEENTKKLDQILNS